MGRTQSQDAVPMAPEQEFNPFAGLYGEIYALERALGKTSVVKTYCKERHRGQRHASLRNRTIAMYC